MFSAYMVIERLFCPLIRKNIQNKSIKNTDKKIKNLVKVSKFFKIFTTSGDWALSILSGAGVAVILTGVFLFELFAFSLALKVALVVSSVLLVVFLTSGVVGVVYLAKKGIKKAIENKGTDKMKKEGDKMRNEIKEILENCRGNCKVYTAIADDTTAEERNKIDGMVCETIKKILKNHQKDRNRAACIIIEENIEYAKSIYNGYSEKLERRGEPGICLYYVLIILKILGKDDLQEVLKDVSISDKVYEKALQFFHDEFLSYCKSEKENQFRIEKCKKCLEYADLIIKKISNKGKSETWKKKMEKKFNEFTSDKRFVKLEKEEE